jgi:phenylalanyl-tRNA synthetase alpha subunit
MTKNKKTTDEEVTETSKKRFDLNEIKILIPVLVTICSTVFGGGFYIGNQINSVEVAKVEAKCVTEIAQLKSHIEDLNKMMKDSTQDKEQKIVLLTYTQYMISISDFFGNRNERMLKKSEEQKKIFLDYAKKYTGEQDETKIHFLDIDGISLPVKLYSLYLPKKD